MNAGWHSYNGKWYLYLWRGKPRRLTLIESANKPCDGIMIRKALPPYALDGGNPVDIVTLPLPGKP